MTPAALVDTHCHVAHVGDPQTVLAQAREAGVDTVIDIGMGTVESGEVATRAVTLPGVYGTVGVHPNELSEFEEDPRGCIARLRELASLPRVVGLGETGLDFYRDNHAPDVQEEAFRAHIELAVELDRTLVVHCRNAHDSVLRLLDGAPMPARVVMHCFSGDAAYAAECAERGFYCSFAGNLTYKRSDELRTAAAAVPDHLLLIETDAPYLAPTPFRGKPNSPALVVHTARVLADVRTMTFDALSAILRDNCQQAFGIELD